MRFAVATSNNVAIAKNNDIFLNYKAKLSYWNYLELNNNLGSNQINM